jgi:hypothetical protein
MDHGDKHLSEAAEDSLHGEAVDILAATTTSLVAIGAAAALNCQVCLRHLVPTALNNGILAEEVAGALAVAREIRTRACALTDDLSTALVRRQEVPSKGVEPTTKCC